MSHSESNRLNNFAVSNAGIVESLKRSSSALALANNDISESIALIASGNEIVQMPEKVGTAIRSTSMRLRGESFQPLIQRNLYASA